MTDPGSEEYKALEKLEEEGYESAKSKRQEILHEVSQKSRLYFTSAHCQAL